MNNFSRTRTLRWLAGSALLLCASMSHAQWVWLDEKGLKQFSDRPPPNSVPQKRILKQPHQVQAPVVAASDAGAPAKPEPAEVVGKAPPMTTAEREADFRKRAKERAEAEAKATSENAQKENKQAACTAAREYKEQLDSGQRIGVVRNGERGIMGEEERARQQAVAAKMLNGCN